MDHPKSERVAIRNGIWDLWCFGQSEMKIEDPFCRCSVQKQNLAAMSIVEIP
jgi:hypothetical protein